MTGTTKLRFGFPQRATLGPGAACQHQLPSLTSMTLFHRQAVS
jgi:hypothetical protein